MNLLVIDTAGLEGGVGLLAGESMSTRLWSCSQRHSSVLWPSIQELLQERDLALNDLAAVAASCGPGRLTGLRIGLAVAKAICMTQSIPLVAPTRFEQVVAASSIPEGRTPVVLLRLGKDKFGCLSFDRDGQAWRPRQSPVLLTSHGFSDGLQSLIDDDLPCFMGDGANENRLALETVWQGSVLDDSAQNAGGMLHAMVTLANRCMVEGDGLSPEQANVIYLH